jgi:hypothetical protein
MRVALVMKPPRLAAAKRIWVRFLVGWPEHIQQNEVSSQRLYAGPNASRSFEDATGLPRGVFTLDATPNLLSSKIGCHGLVPWSLHVLS